MIYAMPARPRTVSPSLAAASLDSDPAHQLAAAAQALPQGSVVWEDGEDGDPVGVVYFALGPRQWVACTLDDCRELLRRIAACEPDAIGSWCIARPCFTSGSRAVAVDAVRELLR